jgi:hypothetical protein
MFRSYVRIAAKFALEVEHAGFLSRVVERRDFRPTLLGAHMQLTVLAKTAGRAWRRIGIQTVYLARLEGRVIAERGTASQQADSRIGVSPQRTPRSRLKRRSTVSVHEFRPRNTRRGRRSWLSSNPLIWVGEAIGPGELAIVISAQRRVANREAPVD